MALSLRGWSFCAGRSSLQLRKLAKSYFRTNRFYESLAGNKVEEMPSCPQSTEKKPFERLPKTVVPHVYHLCLKPDLEKFTFDGTVKIDVTVAEPTQKIFLNALDLKISSASFSKNGTETKAKEWNINKETEVATVVFPNQLETGNGELSFVFTGNLNDKLHGFYRSQYKTPSGEVRYAATTQFESSHARQAFPCWDEPAIKAKFNVTLVVPKDRVALSNMNVISEENDEEPSKKIMKFATTPIMSTYLLAFVVGEYDYIEDVSSNGVKVRVYTPVGKKEQGMFALDVAVRCLSFYDKYFNIAYPLPKMDLIAIADFDAGAMENWGLVTFRETCILFDEKNTSAFRKQMIAVYIAHELAHQWFGNLVTMDWWTHLWLNEGFASFMEYYCVANLHPEFDMWMQFVTDVSAKAFELDGLHSSHPIEVPVGHPSEVTEIFDDISYRKGSTIIRMLHEYIGNECFSDGLSLYLKKHAYKNTVTEDLWEAFEEVSKKPVGQIMTTWTKQKGFPVITVSSRQEGNNRILTLSQEKFCSNGKYTPLDKKSQWMIPVVIRTQSKPNEDALRLLLESKSTEVLLENVPISDWVKLNPSTVGFYRVNYSPEMLSQFIPAVKDKSLPPLDRLGIQNDLFAMVQEGRASTVDLFKMLEAYIDEDSYAVWDSINDSLAQLSSLLSHTQFQNSFHKFGRNLMTKISAKLGWNVIENESHLDTMLRAIVIGRLVNFKDEATISEAKKLFHGHVNGTCIIPADIRASVYRAAAANADDKTFETLLSLYRKADLQEEKNRVTSAMAFVKDPLKIQKVLEFSLSNEVRSQDAVTVISCVAATKDGCEPAWQFFQDNFKELHRRYEGGFLMCLLVENITKSFSSEEKALEIERFFAQNPVPSADRPLQQSLEYIRLKADWFNRDSAAIKTFFERYNV